MTSWRDRVYAQLSHRETQPIPYTLGWEGDVGERLDAHYGGTRWRDLLEPAIRSAPIASLERHLEESATHYTDLYGTVWRCDRRPTHLETPALREPTLAGYRFPTMDALFPAGWDATARHAIAQEPDRFWVAGLGFGLFERTWCLRGFENALADAAADPAFYAELVEAVAAHHAAILAKLMELPLDGIKFSDDWGYQQGVLLGPERWRRYIKPALRRLYAQVHAAGLKTLSHCCGSVRDILPDIIEIGLDALESVQPEARGMNPYQLKREFGREITFWGGLGSQSTIPHGTPAEIKAEVRRLCDEMGRGGGYILGPAKSLQPETPTANAAAVVEAFLEQAGVAL
ncbi:MAG: uroporphyrinogen decarboxylase family protein [Anaerolineae bacterium]|jgi:uroporphyrinogen decarboxylase